MNQTSNKYQQHQTQTNNKQNVQNFKPELYSKTASSYQLQRNYNNKYVQQVEDDDFDNAMIHSNVSNKVDNEERRYSTKIPQQRVTSGLGDYNQYLWQQKIKLNNLSSTNRYNQQITPSSPNKNSIHSINSSLRGKELQKPLTLALDIDLTLIYSTMGLYNFYDHQFTIHSGNYSASYSFNERPGLHQFLVTMKKYYNLIIFTSAGQIYADKIIEYIDPNNEFFVRRYYQQNCVPAVFLGQRILVKDLSVISPNIKNIILIDDNSFACKNQPLNLIQCQPYRGNKDDDELDRLSRRLIKIHNTWVEKGYQEANIGVNKLINKIF